MDFRFFLVHHIHKNLLQQQQQQQQQQQLRPQKKNKNNSHPRSIEEFSPNHLSKLSIHFDMLNYVFRIF